MYLSASLLFDLSPTQIISYSDWMITRSGPFPPFRYH